MGDSESQIGSQNGPVEGLPDRDFYYLIGVRVGRELLAILESAEEPVLVYYGSFKKTCSLGHGASSQAARYCA
jgi:hypothetical protein